MVFLLLIFIFIFIVPMQECNRPSGITRAYAKNKIMWNAADGDKTVLEHNNAKYCLKLNLNKLIPQEGSKDFDDKVNQITTILREAVDNDERLLCIPKLRKLEPSVKHPLTHLEVNNITDPKCLGLAETRQRQIISNWLKSGRINCADC